MVVICTGVTPAAALSSVQQELHAGEPDSYARMISAVWSLSADSNRTAVTMTPAAAQSGCAAESSTHITCCLVLVGDPQYSGHQPSSKPRHSAKTVSGIFNSLCSAQQLSPATPDRSLQLLQPSRTRGQGSRSKAPRRRSRPAATRGPAAARASSASTSLPTAASRGRRRTSNTCRRSGTGVHGRWPSTVCRAAGQSACRIATGIAGHLCVAPACSHKLR
jgi:hypothetical protein